MNVVHIMADGTKRKSIEGVVIQSKDFYEVLNAIQRKKE
jgi:hypothetical protein